MILPALKKVFRDPRFVVLASGVSAAMFLLATWLPNISLITSVIGSSDIPVSEKIGLLASLSGSIATNFTPFSASYTVAIAILFGIYIAMTAYVLRSRTGKTRQGGMLTGFLGVGSGALGVGCAACGSFLLPGTLSLLGASGAVALLPLDGGEFGVIGTLLLAATIYAAARQIENPSMCKIGTK